MADSDLKLQQKGALKKYFEDYRRSFRKNVSGAAAAEAALGVTPEVLEKDFAAHVGALPWLHRERFLAWPAWAQVGLTSAMLLLALGYGGQKYDFVYFAF